MAAHLCVGCCVIWYNLQNGRLKLSCECRTEYQFSNRNLILALVKLLSYGQGRGIHCTEHTAKYVAYLKGQTHVQIRASK